MLSNYFYKVEGILFWFFESQKQRGLGFCNKRSKSEREYTIDDIAIILQRLNANGALSEKHMKVLQKYCSETRVPDSNSAKEQGDYTIWEELISELYQALMQKELL